MRRLAILSIFDSDGIIDRYLLYYAKSILDVVDELIIVVNGKVRDDDFFELEKLTKKIIIRENKGYDVGGYKAVAEYLGVEYLLKYDEVILSNDTNFGPFIPFTDIFRTMEEKTADFWGMNYEDRGLFGYIDAYFLVFRKNTIRALSEFLYSIDFDKMSKAEVVHAFEIGLFQSMIRKKYCYAVYTICNNLDLYSVPNLALKEYNLPLMKKRCFEKEKYVEDNCLECLRYIKDHYDYDINLILETAKRKYGVVYNLEEDFTREFKPRRLLFPKTKLNQEELIALSGQNKKMYIYGTGCFGKTLYYLLQNDINFEGFIVSDEYYSDKQKLGKKVYKCSDIDMEKSIIIVAVKEADDIKEKLGSPENVFYLW